MFVCNYASELVFEYITEFLTLFDIVNINQTNDNVLIQFMFVNPFQIFNYFACIIPFFATMYIVSLPFPIFFYVRIVFVVSCTIAIVYFGTSITISTSKNHFLQILNKRDFFEIYIYYVHIF